MKTDSVSKIIEIEYDKAVKSNPNFSEKELHSLRISIERKYLPRKPESPYSINERVRSKIQKLDSSLNTDDERWIIKNIHRMEQYPNMSKYQLSLTKKEMADYYMQQGTTGNALIFYEWALKDNKNLPVKRLISSLKKKKPSELIYSMDKDTIIGADRTFVSSNVLYSMSGYTIEKEHDEQFESYISKELEKLGENYTKSFYEALAIREFEKDFFYSYREWAEKTLQTMRESKEYTIKRKNGTLATFQEKGSAVVLESDLKLPNSFLLDTINMLPGELHMKRKFDLNIEKILDNWEIYHALREIISNALDEMILTQTRMIDIFKDSDGFWHIKDFGRGLRHQHLTQNENEEKKSSKNVIGKFGVGLKDALAVLYKNNIPITILSKYGDITLDMCEKEGFSDTVTLHAVIDAPSDDNRVGTEFIIKASDDDISKAKSLFLAFSDRMALAETNYGEIYTRTSSEYACIYVHGVKVAEESNYLFDYNITKTNAALEKSLNRERSAIGRTAYSELIKKMLLNAKTTEVMKNLIDELKKIPLGTNCDEISLTDVQIHAIKTYNEQNNLIFISTLDSYTMSNNDKEKIKESGREVVIIPDNIFEKVKDMVDDSGKEIGTFNTVIKEYNDSFQYHFIEEADLLPEEKEVLSFKNLVFSIYGDKKYQNKIRIAKNINEMLTGDINGIYDSSTDEIIIKRSSLKSVSAFCSVLFHELVHATTGYPDNDRHFENELAEIIGLLSSKLIEKDKQPEPIVLPEEAPKKKSRFGFLEKLLN